MLESEVTLRPRTVLLPGRFAAAMTLGALATALLTGIPTDLIRNGWFTRMTPVPAYAYVVWAVSAAMAGILIASYLGVRSPACGSAPARSGIAGGALTWLAVGCPVCNKAVVALLGVTGALNWFAPLQPWLAGFAVATMALALALRARALTGRCADAPVPVGSAA